MTKADMVDNLGLGATRSMTGLFSHETFLLLLSMSYNHIDKLFLFGDSYLDTGNNNSTVRCWKFPYGMAVPTGRYSDGLIFTDFLASFMGIESPMPYTQWNNLSKRRVTNGMNFAHGGTGVFDTWMKEGNMTTQINAFKQYIADGVYNKSDLEESIAVVSNAGNDYTQYYEVDHGTHEGYQAFVAKVIDQLELNLREIRKTGVKKVVMLTMQPLGCLPNKARTLSYKKCDTPLNNDTIFHNKLLRKAVQRLNSETTDSPFDILDLYGAFMSVISKQAGEGTSAEFGNPLLKPCCTPTARNALCGSVDANGVKLYTLCANPNDNLFWDLYHPTQSGWQTISSALKPSFDELMQCNNFPRRPSASAFFGPGNKY
ncbi:hypothetical protein MKW98_031085 [Papaver atlanticum]|uniref:GDSL esterase/lipase n=1 Tax=Papaver atlanticum TaxID=357466 RepID=A0AAD4XMP1_9MAGN|nr:hypothetical protein MKW98_031085 [Papaver atlanticum]